MTNRTTIRSRSRSPSLCWPPCLDSRRARASAALTTPQMVDLLKIVDDRQKNNGDWRASAYLEQKEKDKVDVVYETEYYRRSSDQKFMILFLKPKSSAGQGYLRIDKNLWFYDPSVGKWERRTERERIGGTNSRRSDFDESRLAEEYDPTDEGEEKLGAYTRAEAAAQGQGGPRSGVPDDPHLDRQGHQERAQAPGVRAVGAAAAHVVLPEVEEGPQRIEGRRRLVPGGDPLLRRGREGEPDAGADQGGRPEARCPRTCSRRPGSRARAGDVARELASSRRCWPRGPVRRGRRRAARPASRTSSAARSRAPAAAGTPRQAGGPRSRGPGAPRSRAAADRRRRPPPGANTPAPEPPPAAAAASEAREPSATSPCSAPPAARSSTSPTTRRPRTRCRSAARSTCARRARRCRGDAPDRWSLSAPSLLDAYFDARPNPRVRAFILGRMSYNPTAAPSAPPRRPPTASRSAARARSSGGSPHRLHHLQRRRAGPTRSSIRCGSASTSRNACS